MYHKWQSNDAWFLRYWARQTDFFCHFVIFFALLPPNNPKYQNFEKIKKTSGDIIILHICTINYNHMMYGFWDIEHDWQNFFVILDNFLPIYPLKTKKIKTLKKWKKCLELLSFYTSVPNIRIICYTVPEIWRVWRMQ